MNTQDAWQLCIAARIAAGKPAVPGKAKYAKSRSSVWSDPGAVYPGIDGPILPCTA